MRPPTRSQLIALGLCAAVYGVWHLIGRPRVDLDILSTRDVIAEANPAVRATLAEWTTGHFGERAQLTAFTVRRPRWTRAVSSFPSRSYRADLTIALDDSTHCRRLDLTWRDPRHAGQLPEWTRSQHGRDVYSCEGKWIGRVRDDPIRR